MKNNTRAKHKPLSNHKQLEREGGERDGMLAGRQRLMNGKKEGWMEWILNQKRAKAPKNYK